MTARAAAIAAILARAHASGKRVFGFSAQKASCGELLPKKAMPAEWDHLCVEGDAEWQRLETEAESQGETAA